MDALLADFRFALRSLRRTPWFVGLAVLILTLGIGANTALFSLLDAVLFKGLPYKDPDRLVMVSGQNAERSGFRLPIPLFEAVRDRSATVEAISAYNAAGGILRTAGGPVDIRGRHVSANFIELMGVPPLAGRGFLPEEESPDAQPVLVITFSLWQQRLGGDPEALGSAIYLDDTSYTVVGIMPPGFGGYLGGSQLSDYWTPYPNDDLRQRELENGHEPIARLSAGVSIADARRELDAIRATVAPEGWNEQGRTLTAVPLKDDVLGDSAYPLQLLLAAVGVVLLIACANLAQLLLARSDGRVAEFATRKAIGAPASRLFRLSLIESCILSLAGGCGGIALAYWLLPVLLTLAPTEIPRIAEAAIDGRVLLATVALCALTGFIFGFAPALRLSRLSVVQAMKRTPGSLTPHKARFHAGLVVVQVASSVALCVLAGLIGRSFLTLLPTEPGFEAESRVVQILLLRNMTSETRTQRVEDLVRRIENLPEITAVSFGTDVPFGSNEAPLTILEPASVAGIKAERRLVMPNYFQLLQMPMLQGRVFTADDRRDSERVAVVNQTLARKLSADGDVLDRTLVLPEGEAGSRYRIVGVVADTRSNGVTAEVWDEVYIPLTQRGYLTGFLIVQSRLEPGVVDRLLREQVHAWEPTLPDLPWLTATRMEDLMSASVAGPRFAATLSSAFSALALLLAATGVFGLVSYSVSQRLREFGIRAALGAQPGDLLSTALRSAVVWTVAGVAVGLAAAVFLVRFVESQLYAVEALDLPTFAAAGAVMLSVAIFSAYLPARRVAQVDPAATLRAE